MPSEWRKVTLGGLCDFRAGSVFKLQYQGCSTGDYPFIKVSDMNLPRNSIRIRESNNWIDQEIVRTIKAKPLPTGTIVFAKIGEAVKRNRLRMIVQPTIIDNNMMGAVPDTDVVDPSFLFYGMHQFDFGEVVSGTALPTSQYPHSPNYLCRSRHLWSSTPSPASSAHLMIKSNTISRRRMLWSV